MKTIGDRIRQAREFRELSGEELAHKVGYKTQSGISNLENRATGRGGYALTKIAKALDVSLEWLLNGPDTTEMQAVQPFKAREQAGQALVCSENNQNNYLPERSSQRQHAHSLIEQTSDYGLALCIEVLESMSARYPMQQENSTGVRIPVNEKVKMTG